MPYITAAEAAARIRTELKRAHGWTSRQVSVRAENFSLGSAVNVVIKDAAIPLPIVKRIAERAEDIRRDHTGEILSGGNRYVSVHYSDEAMRIFARRYVDAVQRAVTDLGEGDTSRLVPVAGTDFLVGRSDGWRLTLWDKDVAGCIAPALGDVDSVARHIGALMVARAADAERAIATLDQA